MSYYYSKKSHDNLIESHLDLQLLFNEVIKGYDNSILCGYRGRADQNKFYIEKKSKVQWPDSEHNKIPSLAIDSAPYPIDWSNIKRFYHYAGYVLGIAYSLNIKIRWGGDWDRDNDLDDQSFNDLIHFEIIL